MQALGHVRLARGVVGKASVVTGIALLAMASVGWRIDVAWLPLVIGAVLLTICIYLGAVLWFAHKHPEQALLEGAEIIQYREQEMIGKGLTASPRLPQRREPPPTMPTSEE